MSDFLLLHCTAPLILWGRRIRRLTAAGAVCLTQRTRFPSSVIRSVVCAPLLLLPL